MLRAEQVQDLETAKEMLRLYEAETARLHERLRVLISEVAALKGKDPKRQLELEIVRLQEELALLRHQMFGRSSERRGGPDDKEKPTTDRRGHGPRAQPELPLDEVRIELPEADRCCPLCGGELGAWEGQTEDADEITVVERHFVLRRVKRQKYRCDKGCAPVTAPAPAKLIEGGRYSLEFAVHVATNKYLFHLPLERQVRMYASEGLVIDSQTLWDQIEALARHLQPSYLALPAEIFSKPVIHADETPWLMLDRGPGRKWYAWTTAAPDAVMYRILPSRSGATAKDVLDAYRGVVMVDGYSAYETAARAGPDGVPKFKLVFCWAHVRRKFVQVEKFAPQSAEILDFIAKLYEVERDLPDPFAAEGEARAQALAHRLAIRRAQSAPILEQIWTWAAAQSALPESRFRKAIEYMTKRKDGLSAFVEDPWVPLDNNHVERQLRDVVMGRKNHLGSKSIRGTEVTALFYSLIDTAKLRGEDPAAFLLRAARAAIDSPGTVTLPKAVG